MNFRSISSRLVLFFFLAALLPLLVFGLLSIHQAQRTTQFVVTEGNSRVAEKAAELINQYIQNAVSILSSTAENINHADLKTWQEERILKNLRTADDKFGWIHLRNLDGSLIVTSELNADHYKNPTGLELQAIQSVMIKNDKERFFSSVYLQDLSPAILVAVPVKKLSNLSSILIAEINLMQMWILVDQIKIGKSGVIHVIDNDGHLIATGDGNRKKEVFQEKLYEPQSSFEKIFQKSGTQLTNPEGIEVLSIGHKLPPPLGWSVLIEEPITQAFAISSRMMKLLLVIMLVIMSITSIAAYRGGTSGVIHPVKTLVTGLEEISKGNLTHKVQLKTNDEFSEVADAINQMSTKLKTVQEKLIIEERHSFFGRIASGLAHDLKHPFQAIESVIRLFRKNQTDPQKKELFEKTTERELIKINLIIDNLHNIEERPLRPLSTELVSFINDCVETFSLQAANQNVAVEIKSNAPTIIAKIDREGFSRVFSNLISNALYVMPNQGRLTLEINQSDEKTQISVQDTGPGIPEEKLSSLFDDFYTTKLTGLGIGLSITKKIVEQHGGKISAQNTSSGAYFLIIIPKTIG